MKILVTGANGQLGSELRNVLERDCPGITIYTDIEELDLTNANLVERFVAENDISHIINCAAYTSVEKAEEEQAACLRVNFEAVRNIANAAYKAGAKVLHISTDYVFDGTAHRPYKESDKVNPIQQYGTSKRKGETVLLALCSDAIVIRTSWLYSPYGHNFVKTMLKLGNEKPALRVVSDQIGTPTYALDLANAISRILRARQWAPGTYHFSDEGVCSWYDFAKAIHRIGGIKDCYVEPIPTEDYMTPATRPAYSVLDKTRIKKTYDLEIPHWEESLEHCIKRLQS